MNRKPGYGAQLRANLEPTKGVGRLRQQDGGHGSRNPLRRGRGGRRKTRGVSPGGAAVGADLGGSSKYSNENFEGRRGERFHVNGTCTCRRVGSSGRKSTARRVVSGAPPAALENPEDRVPSAPRVVLITASGLQGEQPLVRLEQCRQREVGKRIRNLGKRIGSEGWAQGVPVPNPSAAGALLELLPRRERVAACRPGDGLGTGSFGGLPRATNSRLRTVKKFNQARVNGGSNYDSLKRNHSQGNGLGRISGERDPVELDSSPTL
ncbi:hypothetical protein V6N13_082721 [Hibiscus sabdariffa]